MTIDDMPFSGASEADSFDLPKVIRHPEAQRWLGNAVTHAAGISNRAWALLANQKRLTLQIGDRAWCVVTAAMLIQLVSIPDLQDHELAANAEHVLDDETLGYVRIPMPNLAAVAVRLQQAAYPALEALLAQTQVRPRPESHSVSSIRYLRAALNMWLPQPSGIPEAGDRSIPASGTLSAETFNVLARLTVKLTRPNYISLLPELRAYVRKPFESLLNSILTKLPTVTAEQLETSHGVIAPFLRDDGGGVESPAPLACFCLLGRNRRRDAYLFVQLDRDGVVFGFHAGALNEERRATFFRRIRDELMRDAHALQSLVRGFVLGEDFTPADELLAEVMNGEADAFLSITQRLPTSIVLRLSVEETSSRIASGFVSLFKYLALAAIDDYAYESEDLLVARAQPQAAPLLDPRSENRQPYSLDDACQGLLHSREEVEAILRRLGEKKNIIVEGPPGVGKTFLAARVARAHVGHTGASNVLKVQFHQSYGYEDFVQGYRPSDRGTFELKSGAFYDLCQLAHGRPLENFVLIVDEFNRGNVTRILGELLSLIEHDKRNDEYGTRLTYGGTTERFFVPPNLYVLALMNTADRSIALMDHALRRRFSVFTLAPQFNGPFRGMLLRSGATEEFADSLIRSASAMNSAIRNHSSLGPGFEVGHSYFLPQDNRTACDARWLATILDREIRPLLREYWVDAPDEIDRLLRPFPI